MDVYVCFWFSSSESTRAVSYFSSLIVAKKTWRILCPFPKRVRSSMGKAVSRLTHLPHFVPVALVAANSDVLRSTVMSTELLWYLGHHC